MKKELVKIKFKKHNNQIEFIQLLTGNCDNTDDTDCEHYFENECENLIEIFDKIKTLKEGEYVIEYYLISGYTITDFGQEYFVDYELSSIKAIKTSKENKAPTSKQQSDNDSNANVGRNCYDCANMASMQSDVVCHVWCTKTDRDFTFGSENTEICEFFEED